MKALHLQPEFICYLDNSLIAQLTAFIPSLFYRKWTGCISLPIPVLFPGLINLFSYQNDDLVIWHESYLIAFQTSKPSKGLVPLVCPPARCTSVGSQSEIWMSSWLSTPFCFSKGLATKPTPLTPPSQRVHFLPLSGQLFPPAKVCPPLSEKQINKNNSWWERNSTILPTTSFYSFEKIFSQYSCVVWVFAYYC